MRVYNKTAKTIIYSLVIAVLAAGFCGCRARITNNSETDRVISDRGGFRTQKYEQQRKKLDLSDVKSDDSGKAQKVRSDKSETGSEKNSENSDSGKKTGRCGSENQGTQSGMAGRQGSDTADADNEKKSRNVGDGDNRSGEDRKDQDGKNAIDGNDTENEKKITVLFDANGGFCKLSEKRVIIGHRYGDLPTPTRNGYNFEGWFTALNGGRNITGRSTIISEKNHTLYARWRKAEAALVYTVKFDANGGRIKVSYAKRLMKQGDVYGSLPLPVKTGYDFSGWFTSATGGRHVKESDKFNSGSDLTLYAHWKYNPYKYWSSERISISESLYGCQVVDCYIEFSNHETASSCDLLSDCKIGNCARNIGSKTIVTDEWIKERNPFAIIKCAGDMSDAASLKQYMKQRFPNHRILVVPGVAVRGSENERLYYSLCLGKSIYLEWFGRIDVSRMSRELNVSGNIFE